MVMRKSPRNYYVIFGSLAVTASLGAVQIAVGEAAPTLADRFQALDAGPLAAVGIDRTAKGDRKLSNERGNAHYRTILLKLENMDSTSVLMRIPRDEQARNLGPARSSTRPPSADPKKMTVACEPPVSLLTEVAKLLQPGRCVT